MRAILAIAIAFSLALVGPAGAQEVADKPTALGTLELKLTPGARVTTDPKLSDGLFRIALWRQKGAVGPQVAQSRLPLLRSFHTVPYSRNALRLELRLVPEVRGVEVEREGDTLRLTFTDRRFAGLSVQLQNRRVQEALDRRRNQSEDPLLTDALLETLVASRPWVEQAPILWPVGADSPVRPPLPLNSGPRRVPRPPVALREAWMGSELLSNVLQVAEAGDPRSAIRELRGLAMPSDDARALVAALRGYIYSLRLPDGEPYSAGFASDAFVLAAALAPEAAWSPWARGMAGYSYERESNHIEAEHQYRQAIEMAPDHEDRVFWELGRGVAMLQYRRVAQGIEQIRAYAGRLRSKDDDMLFEVRRSVAWGLWKDGEYAQAAAIADLVLAEHPTTARVPALDYFWSRIYLDAGRSAPALPFLERQLAEGKRVWRERARWWLHESALQHRDTTEARRRLKQIIDETPGSTLVPLAKTRLLVLDSLAVEGKGEALSFQQTALGLREFAVAWPQTVVEGEALSYVAQLWLHLDLVQDGLNLYAWIEERNPGYRGPVARDEFYCRAAPTAFRELRSLGEVTRALGVYRGFLDDPSMHGCVDSQMRNDAAQAAMVAGLPNLAARWLGQAVAEGTSGLDESRHLVSLADIYVQQGKIDAAEQTLDYLQNSDLPEPPTQYAAARGDVYRHSERWEEALAAYDQALTEASLSVRTQQEAPMLHYHRGLVLQEMGELDDALVALRTGVEQGGAEDPVLGWLMVAAVGVRVAKTPEAWQAVIEAVDTAEEGEPGDSRARALQYYRASALEGLGKTPEAEQLLAGLAQGTDAWALRAREHQSRSKFDASVDALVKPPAD